MVVPPAGMEAAVARASRVVGSAGHQAWLEWEIADQTVLEAFAMAVDPCLRAESAVAVAAFSSAGSVASVACQLQETKILTLCSKLFKLHRRPWQTCSLQHQLDFSGRHSAMQQLLRKDCVLILYGSHL